jgi:glycosyltransferase involved in cell wall biosynthesis
MLELILYVIFLVLTFVLIFVAWKLNFAFRNFKIKRPLNISIAIGDLPSVSVCIPARNEMHAMTQCLERVIASDYPKLEIIVLDDSSVDNTSILIKSFAHVGVRFVEGSPLAPGWLGKNYALQGLLNEASGTYVFYMDVDTQIAPNTISQLVAYSRQENAQMISVLPRREDAWRASVVFGTLRYFWELIFHRSSAPATASSAWMINRQTSIEKFNGFNNIKAVIQPESSLSSQLMRDNKYRFLIGTKKLGVAYEKKWRSQIDTSIRLAFPVFENNILSAAIGIIAQLMLLVPFVVLVFDYSSPVALRLSAASLAVAYIGLFAVYLAHIYHRGWWLSAIVWPILIIQEVAILVASVVLYDRHRVNWKGRPVSALVDK